ncbi:hypothetical protein FLK61_28120 [Paenalkalicoccus suaedae]|uniref:Uncharacterized protein n=1 Tax=Paenalkalicoccus suaedae TaxID=2592382 RepID=A0A859FEF3_9BACI|nr:hypothetical protein [Paenalkalicoccus suaedae]QKS70615.1 hypothetical protein FLK61_28120 [Paenalkalicoccus suaedae]
MPGHANHHARRANETDEGTNQLLAGSTSEDQNFYPSTNSLNSPNLGKKIDISVVTPSNCQFVL